MTPEIEKLIDFAVADGVITDKERAVLERKCREAGEDVDEMTMILEAKLYNRGQAGASGPAVPPPPPAATKVKHGSVRKCPACGAEVGAMQAVCGECGHEFVHVDAVTSVAQLSEKLQAIETEKSGLLAKGRVNRDQMEEQFRNTRVTLIKTFPVPNTKEDLLEFLFMATSNVGNNSRWLAPEEEAWVQKTDQIYKKVLVSAADDKMTIDHATRMVISLIKRLPASYQNTIYVPEDVRRQIKDEQAREENQKKLEKSIAIRKFIFGWRFSFVVVGFLMIIIGIIISEGVVWLWGGVIILYAAAFIGIGVKNLVEKME